MESDDYEDDEFICELAWGIDDSLKSEILIKILINFHYEELEPESEIWALELRKLRYALLNYLNDKIKDNGELLEKVEEVYADFSYPVDMEGFIYYMPPKDGVVSDSVEENIKVMINRLENFLSKEKLDLDE